MKISLASKVMALELKQRIKPFYRRPPKKINYIVVDIDHTLNRALSSYVALQKILGFNGAREAYENQKKLVKKGEISINDVKLWGNELQIKADWKKGDWISVAERVFRSAHDPNVIKGLIAAKRDNPNLKIILATGTSSVFAEGIARLLKNEYGLEIDHVIGSREKFDSRGKLVGMEHFIGDDDLDKPKTVSKTTAIKRELPDFDWRKTLAISDADPRMLQEAGVGLLIRTEISDDPQTRVSQKLRLYDVQSKYGALHSEVIREIAANPREKLSLNSLIRNKIKEMKK